jgi:hypothetical protein
MVFATSKSVGEDSGKRGERCPPLQLERLIGSRQWFSSIDPLAIKLPRYQSHRFFRSDY